MRSEFILIKYNLVGKYPLLEYILKKRCLKNIRIKAGKVFLKKIEELIVSRNSFILESTLAWKYLIRFMKKMKQNAYRIELIFIFVENIEEAV
jgi:predicted ABC-type ATPase